MRLGKSWATWSGLGVGEMAVVWRIQIGKDLALSPCLYSHFIGRQCSIAPPFTLRRNYNECDVVSQTITISSEQKPQLQRNVPNVIITY